MIRNRNVATDAFIDVSKIAGFGMGEVFYVYNAADTAVGNWLNDRVASGHLFSCSAAAAEVGIQAALDSCVACRNDYVILMPTATNYVTAATITMSKKCTHLICPAGMAYEIGACNAARISPAGSAAAITITAQSCEVAGLWLRNTAAYPAIQLSSSTYGANIHNNFFAMYVGSGVNLPILYGEGADAGAWGIIEKNWFVTYSATAGYTLASVISLQTGATGARVTNNTITVADGVLCTAGISNQAYKGETSYNTITSGGTAGSMTPGVFTAAISISAAGAAIGNRGAVETTVLLAGGAAGRCYCDNQDGATSAGTPINLES